MKHIAISIVNYKNTDDTLSCLASLAAIKHDGFSVHVYISNNDEANFVLPKKHYPLPITVLDNNENLGFSGGHNVAIKEALKHDATHIVILNNDTILDKDLLTHLIEASDGKNVGIVVPKIYFAKGSEYHKDRYKQSELGKVLWYAGGVFDMKNIIGKHRGVDEVDAGQYDTKEETETATGCCMLVKREVFEKIGLFDERYFLYYEDSDFSMRAKKAGFTILYEPQAVLWHINAGSAGGSGSSLQDYYISRNRLLFGMTYGGPKTKAALFRESVALLRSGREEQKRGIKDYYRRRFFAGSFGKNR